MVFFGPIITVFVRGHQYYEIAELLEDLIRTDQLDEASDDLDMKNNFVTSVMAIKNVLGAVM